MFIVRRVFLCVCNWIFANGCDANALKRMARRSAVRSICRREVMRQETSRRGEGSVLPFKLTGWIRRERANMLLYSFHLRNESGVQMPDLRNVFIDFEGSIIVRIVTYNPFSSTKV
ncbi:hypothetical protein CDAR_74931 [Caerostris darwini]|uniref:Secreted protein n=1 Tax=Caerostris darwini TaxID=1538125 RepID=A0AAV4P056_9ARAC|nr:hypothetical protein CDAR_74931 [Caerostris darwini]